MTSTKLKQIEDALEVEPKVVVPKLISFIRERVRGAGASGVVLGLSGGLDSSVTVTLCSKALGPKKVMAISMPETGVTNPGDSEHARGVARKLRVEFREVEISPVVGEFRRILPDFKPKAPLASANLKPRIRMIILYYYANLLNRLVVGCGNRSEIRTGYFTKYGDGAADFLPLGSLYKTQVRRLATYLEIPKEIIEKTPTAGLWKGQTDEGELGMKYRKLDMIFTGLDLGLKPEVISATVGVEKEKVLDLVERERRMAHKLGVPEAARV